MNFDPAVLCRPAVAADWPELIPFLNEIWEGEDYVPSEWEEWLYREKGVLAVAEAGGKVLALGHLLDMGHGEWWLEGLRVDPQAWGQGIGSRMHDYFIERWLASSGQVVRLATHLDRKPVHAMCERTGFEAIAQFTCISSAIAPSEKEIELEELPSDRWQQAIDAIQKGPSCQFFGGLIDFHWRFGRPIVERLGDGYDDRVLRSDQGDSHIVRLDLEEPEPAAHLLATSSTLDRLDKALLEISDWAAQVGVQDFDWLAPNSSEFLEPAEKAGLQAGDAGVLLIFERSR